MRADSAPPLPDAAVLGGAPVQPAATAAASMFATGATSSTGNGVAEDSAAGIYSSSRRASSSRLIAEISASAWRTASPASTRRRTSPASTSGT